MQRRMHLHQPRAFHIILLLSLLSQLATSTPTPSNTTNLQAALPDQPIVADTCPTPPTQFLPYAPPPGYTPAPGCAPANTQPSESNPPGGVYGSGGNGASGSTETVYSSMASGNGRKVGSLLSWAGVGLGLVVLWEMGLS